MSKVCAYIYGVNNLKKETTEKHSVFVLIHTPSDSQPVVEQKQEEEVIMEFSDDIDVDLGDIEADMGEDIVVMEEEDTKQQQPPQKIQEDSETSDESAPVKDEAKDTVAPSASESESDVVVTKVSAQKNLKVPPKEPTTKPLIDAHPAFNGGGTGIHHFDELFGLGAASTIIEDSSSSEDEQQEGVKENGHHKKEHSSKSKKDSKKKDKKEKKSKKDKKTSNGKSSSSSKSKPSSSRSKPTKSEETEQEPSKGARKRKQPAESVQQTTSDQGENHLKYDPLVLVSKRPKFKKRGTFAKELIKEKAWELTKQVCEKLSNENSKDPETHDTFNFMEAIKDCKTDEESNWR